MSQAPSMPMFWDAYLADTTHLTTEEHGAYLLLLAAMWRRNGTVPDNDKDNARILGLTPGKWRKIKARLSPLLEIDDGHISQKNLQKIWKNTQEKIAKNRENGAKGGRPKSSKNKDMAKAKGSVSQNPNETIPEPEPEPYKREEPKGSLSSGDDEPKEIDQISEAVSAYNVAAKEQGWPQVQTVNQKRRSSLKARLKECGGLDGWAHALSKARASPFCNGDNSSGWVASFDFIIQQSSFAKLMEGNYDNRTPARKRPTAQPGRPSTGASMASIAAGRELERQARG